MIATAVRRAVLPGLVLVVLTACTSSPPDARFDVDDLAEGPCRQAGPSLLEVDRTQGAFTAEDIDAMTAAADYPQLQDDLLAARGGSTGEVADGLRSLVTAMGFFRVGVAAGTSNEDQQQQLQGGLDEVLRACGVPLDED